MPFTECNHAHHCLQTEFPPCTEQDGWNKRGKNTPQEQRSALNEKKIRLQNACELQDPSMCYVASVLEQSNGRNSPSLCIREGISQLVCNPKGGCLVDVLSRSTCLAHNQAAYVSPACTNVSVSRRCAQCRSLQESSAAQSSG